MSDRSARRLALGLGVLVLALWSSALAPGGPSYDDLEGVAANPLVNGERSPLAALTTDYWHHRGDAGHLRPLALWSLALDHRLFGAWWPGFHLTGLLWNAAVVVAGCLVVAALGRRLGIASEVRRAGMVGLALAMCHPLLADSMAWVSGRTSPMSVLPGLLACLVLLRLPAGRPWTAAALAGLGLAASLLGKEDGLAAALPLAGVLWVRRELRPGALGLATGLGLWLALRVSVFGSALPAAPFAPLADLPLAERLLQGGRTMLDAPMALLVGMQIPPVHNLPHPDPGPVHLGGWLLWLLAWVPVLARRPAATSVLARAGLAGALLAWVPYQGWIPAGELMAGRFFYLPLLFAGPWLGEVTAATVRRLKLAPTRLSVAGLFALFLVNTWATRPYTSLVGFYERQLSFDERDPVAWNGMGLALEEAGRTEDARAAYQLSILHSDSTYGRALSNLGRLLLEEGDPEDALRCFEAAAEAGPGNPVAWANLGRLRLDLDRTSAGEEAYARAAHLAPGMATAWRGLVRARLTAGDLEGAKEALLEAERLAPDDERTRSWRAAYERAAPGP